MIEWFCNKKGAFAYLLNIKERHRMCWKESGFHRSRNSLSFYTFNLLYWHSLFGIIEWGSSLWKTETHSLRKTFTKTLDPFTTQFFSISGSFQTLSETITKKGRRTLEIECAIQSLLCRYLRSFFACTWITHFLDLCIICIFSNKSRRVMRAHVWHQLMSTSKRETSFLITNQSHLHRQHPPPPISLQKVSDSSWLVNKHSKSWAWTWLLLIFLRPGLLSKRKTFISNRRR